MEKKAPSLFVRFLDVPGVALALAFILGPGVWAVFIISMLVYPMYMMTVVGCWPDTFNPEICREDP